MNVPPPSLSEKLALAILFWLFSSFLSIPLWDLADMFFHAFRYGRLVSALLDTFLSPIGTIFGLIVMFGITAEHGIGSIAERYWPAVLIAFVFTALFSHWWWRRS